MKTLRHIYPKTKPVVITKKIVFSEEQLNAFLSRIDKKQNVTWWEVDDCDTFDSTKNVWNKKAVVLVDMLNDFHSIPTQYRYEVSIV